VIQQCQKEKEKVVEWPQAYGGIITNLGLDEA
jgi:hypothetical protein